MAKYLTTDTDLTSVANAIRTKGGTSAPLAYPAGFVSAIDAIPTGGGGEPVEEKDVNFIDYDGTILYSYTAAEAQELSALPDNPSHDGLTAQGWNWTLAQIKTQLTAFPGSVVYIGQMYVTSNGKTEIDVSFENANYLSPYLEITPRGTIAINWGDGGADETITGNSLTFIQHTYTSIGEYTISIEVVSGEVWFNGVSNDYSSLLTEVGQNNLRLMGQAYSRCVKAIRLGNDVKMIYCAFQGLIRCETITMPSNLKGIDAISFKNCYGLRCIVIPSGFTKILASSFFNCCSLVSISMPPSITEIEMNAFNGCYFLQKIGLTSNLTIIGIGAFTNCYNLCTIKLPTGMASFGNNAFGACRSLRNLEIPSGVTSISNGLISNCHSIIEINLPNTVTSIGQTAISNCYSLEKLVVPSSVTTIGAQAFANNYGAKEYHFLSETPPTLANSNAFSNIQAGTKIYVPSGKLTAYQTADNWSTYATYMEEEPA